jgi:hypothetical protein
MGGFSLVEVPNPISTGRNNHKNHKIVYSVDGEPRIGRGSIWKNRPSGAQQAAEKLIV